MKRLNDITGVLKGLKLIQEAYVKDIRKCSSKRNIIYPGPFDILNKSKVFENFKFFPTTCLNGICLILFEAGALTSYKFTSKFSKESSNKSYCQEQTIEKSDALKSDENIKNNHDFGIDQTDKQLIEEFRQQHPEILNKSLNLKSDMKKEKPYKTKEIHTYAPMEMISKEITENSQNLTSIKKESTLDKERDVQLFGHARKVPSTELGRAFSFASLFARVGVGALTESTRRQLNLKSSESNPFLTEANAKRIVDSLCKVRGAALKLGQMLSIQDSEFVNPKLQEIFERVRQNADFMPVKQMKKVLVKELGEDWSTKFLDFNERPFAAASIGQVHKAVLLNGQAVAVKIQYPGVKQSIDSDIKNLMSLLKFVSALPPGLHAEKAIEVAKRELAWECNYLREAEYANFFTSAFKDDPVFVVPKVIPEFSTEKILTTELVDGCSLDKCISMDQEIRNWIGSQMMRLCLKELFELRTMQTDPNWANFLFNITNRKIYLIDFGSSREYKKSFIDDYLRVIKYASIQDRENILRYSRKLGFLTGFETKVMEQAHIDAVSILGEVFTSTLPFDFGQQSTTKRIKELIPIMLEHRLTSPPEETYSIHRKLSGGFLLCSKLKARVSCSKLFNEIYNSYIFD